MKKPYSMYKRLLIKHFSYLISSLFIVKDMMYMM